MNLGRWSRGSNRVNRGGSWRNDDASNFRGANRNRNDPSNRNDNQGFRLASTLAKHKVNRLSNPSPPVSRLIGTETEAPPPPVSHRPTAVEVRFLRTGSEGSRFTVQRLEGYEN